jgi:transposase
LEIDLLEAAEPVVRVLAKLMAEQRRLARTRDKSDPIDALAVARAALREPDWPTATHDEAPRELRLLVDRREDLVADPAVKAINQVGVRRRPAVWLDGLGPQAGIDARLARDVLTDIDRICPQISALEWAITVLVDTHQAAARLAALPGCAVLTAAKIVGETAGIVRFADEARYAMHAGVVPIRGWSGRTRGRVRVSRTGSRQLDAALHRIAVTQIRCLDSGKAYYAERVAAGDTRPEAIRRLKRRLARTVFDALKNNPSSAGTHMPAAA